MHTGKKIFTAEDALNSRETEHAIIGQMINWQWVILYDTRKTPYDVKKPVADYAVETINTDGNLTIIEV